MTPYSLPGANPCSLMGLVQSGAAFSTTALTSAYALSSSIGSVVTQMENLPSQLTALGIADAASLASSISAQLSGAISQAVTGVIGHIGGLIGDTVAGVAGSLTSALSMAIGQLGLNQGLLGSGCSPTNSTNTGAGASPCAGMNGFFGSVMGDGAALINQMTSTIATVTSQVTSLVAGVQTMVANDINTALATINGLVGQAAAVATQVTSMVANEVAAMASAAADMLHFATANMLNSLFGHPCGQQVLQAAGSPGLLSAIGGTVP